MARQHLGWFACDVDDETGAEVIRILGDRGVHCSSTPPVWSPDLVIARWDQRADVLQQLGREDWAGNPPAALVYLAAEQQHDAVAHELADDVLADALLLPVRATGLALAAVRALARRDHYRHLGAGRLTSCDDSHGGLVGNSALLTQAITLAHQVAGSPGTSVLIEGESGTVYWAASGPVHPIYPDVGDPSGPITGVPSARRRPFIRPIVRAD